MKLYSISFIEQPYEKYLEWVETIEKRGEKHVEFVRFLHGEKMALVRLTDHAHRVLWSFQPRRECADRSSSQWKTEFGASCELLLLSEAEFLSKVGPDDVVVFRLPGVGRHWPNEEQDREHQFHFEEVDGRLWASRNPENHTILTKTDLYKVFGSERSISREEALALVAEAEAE